MVDLRPIVALANGGSSANGVSAAKSGFVDTDSSAANGVFKAKMGSSRPT